ncbi:hypothetical protein B5M47_02120 [candidate division CPR3 bacterium 4484_211]|uniref:DNA polymerase III subunit gamma/tau n=1 Tax=candidate division CPR3 bacterium 4484_211 TaxID=1968527 RepID=A0A1W9NYA0_UNCC3|nr:MAG: hypothetical protein B5M47_02120 [candidate division CPR3 bacterium 4484_211]
MVLYRKYRPQKFSEVVGQDHVTATLRNALKNGQVAHAYLFAGARGTGKTSVARILARAVNCTSLKNGEPCGRCSSCRAIARGTFLDLVEIDAASNRGIDDVRAMREQVHFQPSSGKYKVYVLDEVHMLTKEAFNALLKTLEEPPEHIIFILCTTEPHRLPLTVVSRCQRFNFKLADETSLAKYIVDISKKEEIEIHKTAASLIARQAGGSFRDGLSLLEQIREFSPKMISREKVIEVLGLSSEIESRNLLCLLADGNVKEALELVENLARQGRDLHNFAQMVILALRESLREALSSGKQKKSGLSVKEIIELIGLLQRAGAEIRSAAVPQLPLEVALVKFGQFVSALAENREASTPSLEVDEKSAGENGAEIITDPDVDLEAVWAEVMEKVKPYNHSVHALLKGGHLVGYQSGTAYLEFYYKFHKERVEEERNRLLVEKMFAEVIGRPVVIACRLKSGGRVPPKKDKDLDDGKALEFKDTLGDDDLVKIAQEILGGEVKEME